MNDSKYRGEIAGEIEHPGELIDVDVINTIDDVIVPNNSDIDLDELKLKDIH